MAIAADDEWLALGAVEGLKAHITAKVGHDTAGAGAGAANAAGAAHLFVSLIHFSAISLCEIMSD